MQGFRGLLAAREFAAKAQRGRSKVDNYFINYSHVFFKSAMAVNINPVFEQDPTFPFYGSAEERAAFYSAKISRSDDKKG